MGGMYYQDVNILFRSPNWVGDAVMATPALRAWKQAFPNTRVHVLAKRWVAPVWENNPDVARIVFLDDPQSGPGEVYRTLRHENYALALVLPNSFSSAWMAFWSGSRKRVGYATQHRSWLLTTRVPWVRGTQREARPRTYLRLVEAAGATGASEAPLSFALGVTEVEAAHAAEILNAPAGKKIIGLAPGSVALSRRWPVERYAQLADRLAERGYAVVLVGSASDALIAQRVVEQARFKPRILAGTTGLREAIAITRHLDCLISNDSGAMHLAYPQGVPVVVLQGAADPNETGPFGPRSRTVRASEPLDCAPCVRNECVRGLECMLGISVERVMDAVEDLLRVGRKRV